MSARISPAAARPSNATLASSSHLILPAWLLWHGLILPAWLLWHAPSAALTFAPGNSKWPRHHDSSDGPCHHSSEPCLHPACSDFPELLTTRMVRVDDPLTPEVVLVEVENPWYGYTMPVRACASS